MLQAVSTPRSQRMIVVVLLFGLSFASYVERVNVSVAAELMMPSLSLTKGDMAFIFNSFLIGYALFQIPMGWLGDRFGPRLVLGTSAFAWGLLTLASGLLPGGAAQTAGATVSILWGLRFLLGVAEASTYPVASRAVHEWMNPSRRGTGSSIMLMGSSVGSAVTAPFVAWSMLRYGWRASFYLTAIVAFVVSMLWLSFTRIAQLPDDTSSKEVVQPRQSGRWLNMNVVLLGLSYFAEGYLLFTFISWLYIYLVEVRGFSLATGGLVASLPWLAAILATPLGGVLSDHLTKRFGRIGSARFLIMIGYSVSGILLLVAASVHGRGEAVLALCISLGFMYIAESSFWTTATIVAGNKGSSVAGFMNSVGILGGIVANTLVPLLVKHYGQDGWVAAFSCGTALGLLTAILWWFLGRRLAPSTVKA